jgi:hypothetical protein
MGFAKGNKHMQSSEEKADVYAVIWQSGSCSVKEGQNRTDELHPEPNRMESELIPAAGRGGAAAVSFT